MYIPQIFYVIYTRYTIRILVFSSFYLLTIGGTPICNILNYIHETHLETLNRSDASSSFRARAPPKIASYNFVLAECNSFVRALRRQTIIHNTVVPFLGIVMLADHRKQTTGFRFMFNTNCIILSLDTDQLRWSCNYNIMNTQITDGCSLNIIIFRCYFAETITSSAAKMSHISCHINDTH